MKHLKKYSDLWLSELWASDLFHDKDKGIFAKKTPDTFN